MTASIAFLTIVVSVAVSVTALAPILLLILWFMDWKKGQLW
jgi:hypothetical protein